MAILLSIGIAVIIGLLMTRIAKRFGLPAVTAYLVTGLLIGPYCLGQAGLSGIGFTSMEFVEKLELVSKVALGFIAFSIGNEFRLSSLKQTGKQATIVGIVQGLVAAAFVDAALIGLHFLMPDKLSISAAITLGAIATATAPAATLMVVRQYKAKGKLTDILLPVVALDDAVGLIVFAISFGIAKALNTNSFDLISIIVEPLCEIVFSLILGAFMGAVLTELEKVFNSNTNRLNLAVAFVFLTVAISLAKFRIGELECGFSSLLVCMMMGTVFCNMCPLSEDLMEKAEKWTSPLYVLFFVISGAELELNVLTDVAVIAIGVVYILFRSAGKYYGAYWSCKMSGCDEKVTKHLGITLLPQAGVALGMCVTAKELGADGNIIRNVILLSVLVYELVGPAMTKNALIAAGDIQPKSEEVVNRRQTKLEHAQKKREELKNS